MLKVLSLVVQEKDKNTASLVTDELQIHVKFSSVLINNENEVIIFKLAEGEKSRMKKKSALQSMGKRR